MLCGFGIKLRYVVSEYSVFVKITKSSQESPNSGALLDKVADQRLWKEDLAKVFFYEFSVVFKNIDIVEHLHTAGSKVQKNF